MRSILLPVAFTLLPYSATPSLGQSPEAVPAAAEGLKQRIDAYLERLHADGFHGSLLVVRDGDPLIDRGVGLRDREAGLANGPATVYDIGSLTKQFTAAAVMKLADRGELDPHDLLSKHLPGVPEDKAAITLHQLLTHSAGFPDALGGDYEPVGREAFVELALAAPLRFAPGSRYGYSNVGYSLLGAVVELVSGQSYERFLRDELLAPAGIAHTGYRLPDWSKAEIAVGYDQQGERWGTMLDHPWDADGPYWHLRCNGGLLSTTHDLFEWVMALHGGNVLGPSATAAVFQPHVVEGPVARSHYGYGWTIFRQPHGTPLITHNGGNGIYFADVLWAPDDGVFIALLSNASARGMQDTAWEIGRMCLDPDYEPRAREAGQPLGGLPEGPAGERLRALSELLGSAPDDAALRAWLEANLNPSFLVAVPLERHLDVFRQLCTDIGANRIESIEQVPLGYFLNLRSELDQGLHRIQVGLNPSNARIWSLSTGG
jgi:CubicO group peptidase (beta-lactamase class C family)